MSDANIASCRDTASSCVPTAHPQRACYKVAYVRALFAVLPAVMAAAPHISSRVARETEYLGNGFVFAVDIAGFGRGIVLRQKGGVWVYDRWAVPDYVIEFRDLDYAFEVFTGACSLKDALSARYFSTQGSNACGVAITYLFSTILKTFFGWRKPMSCLVRQMHVSSASAHQETAHGPFDNLVSFNQE